MLTRFFSKVLRPDRNRGSRITEHLVRADAPTCAVEIRGVCKVQREGQRVLDNVSLEIEAREYFILIGPSGAGKSTLLRILAGHGAPTRGQVLLHGILSNDLAPAERPTSLMFQEYSLFDHLTNWENIVFPLRVQGSFSPPAVAYANELAERAGLSERELKKRPTEISGGERQRVALLRALVWKPGILLLDEPLASVDPSVRSELRLLLKSLAELTQVTTLHVTHSLDDAFELGSRIGVLLGGQLVQTATPHELYAHPASIQVAALLGYVCLRLKEGASGVSKPDTPGAAEVVAVPPTKLRVPVSSTSETSVTGRLMGRAWNPDGSGEHLLMEVECAATRRPRMVRVPIADGQVAGDAGTVVNLCFDRSEAIAFDSVGRPVG